MERRTREPFPIRRKNLLFPLEIYQNLERVTEETGIFTVTALINRFCQLGLMFYERGEVVEVLPKTETEGVEMGKRFNLAIPEVLYQELERTAKELKTDLARLINAFCIWGLNLYDRGVTEVMSGVKTIRTEVQGEEIEIIL